MTSLLLICPALLTPPLDLDASNLPDLPVLRRLLARADQLPNLGGCLTSVPQSGVFHPSNRSQEGAGKTAAQSTEPLTADPIAACLRCAGLAWPPDEDPPSAPLALLGEGLEVGPGDLWCHADPVHLRLDRDRLRLYAGSVVAPWPEETEALVAAFNRHFAGEGVALVAPRPERWYLRVSTELPRVRLAPVYALQGASVGDCLPQGPQALPWVRLLNEVQMLFHAEPINHLRAKAGRPAINGIWVWGGGVLPEQIKLRAELLVGDAPAVRGLAQLGARPWLGVDDWLADPLAALESERCIVLWDRHWRAALDQDQVAWVEAGRVLDRALAHLWQALGSGRLAELCLDPLQGTAFRLCPQHRWRLWRRSRSIAGWQP